MTEVNSSVSALDFWPPLVAVFGGNIILFFIAQIKKDNSIIDTAWGLIFIVPNLIILCRNGHWYWRTILTFTLVTIWGLRLAIHIGVRHPGKEDFRY
jgi:steroid 5-alpha reductase family enzyme